MSKQQTTLASGVDIFNLDPVANSEKGADLELVHPASQIGLGVFINILGNESAEVRAYAKKKVSEQTRKNFANQKGRRPDPDRLAQETVDRIFDRSSSVELAMVAAKGWWRYKNPDAIVTIGQDATEVKGRVDTMLFNGEELPFTPENARKVFEARPWIATQVDAGTQDLDNFFPS